MCCRCNENNSLYNNRTINVIREKQRAKLSIFISYSIYCVLTHNKKRIKFSLRYSKNQQRPKHKERKRLTLMRTNKNGIDEKSKNRTLFGRDRGHSNKSTKKLRKRFTKTFTTKTLFCFCTTRDTSTTRLID